MNNALLCSFFSRRFPLTFNSNAVRCLASKIKHLLKWPHSHLSPGVWYRTLQQRQSAVRNTSSIIAGSWTGGWSLVLPRMSPNLLNVFIGLLIWFWQWTVLLHSPVLDCFKKNYGFTLTNWESFLTARLSDNAKCKGSGAMVLLLESLQVLPTRLQLFPWGTGKACFPPAAGSGRNLCLKLNCSNFSCEGSPSR